jgi:predicted enzyme related to lactoylglutathione lyase
LADGDLGWMELPGGDDCRATGIFYARTFGWLVDDDGETVRFMEPSGRFGGAFRGDLPAAASGPILYVSVGDAAAALDRIRQGGGTVILERAPIAPGVGHRALFRDPAGTTMGLFEPER